MATRHQTLDDGGQAQHQKEGSYDFGKTRNILGDISRQSFTPHVRDQSLNHRLKMGFNCITSAGQIRKLRTKQPFSLWNRSSWEGRWEGATGSGGELRVINHRRNS
ncbi:MAG: hypothetical protein GY696_29260 [Gammaproteobacteria bacterium]|nr:hypothetical protein [Gammaproteobacteria bacterium]